MKTTKEFETLLNGLTNELRALGIKEQVIGHHIIVLFVQFENFITIRANKSMMKIFLVNLKIM